MARTKKKAVIAIAKDIIKKRKAQTKSLSKSKSKEKIKAKKAPSIAVKRPTGGTKKKNRPKFPQGYKKGSKKIKTPSSVQRYSDIIKKAGMQLIERYERNVKKLGELQKDSPAYERLSAIIKRNEYATRTFAYEMSKIKPKKKYWESSLNKLEKIWDIQLHEDVKGQTRMTRESSFKYLLLRQMQEEGIDIYNPNEIAEVLKGEDIDELYKNWKENNENTNNFYEEFKEMGIFEFIKRYKVRKMIREAEENLNIGWEDIK